MKGKSFFLLFFLLGAWSCSTSPGKSDKKDESSGTFSHLKNEDFGPKKSLPYAAHEDNFEKLPLPDSDVLARETLFRLDQGELGELSRAAEADPIARMVILCLQGKVQEGLALGDSLYFTHKNHPSYWNQIGTCYFKEGDIGKARLYYNKALEVSGDYSAAINNLGILYLREKRDQKALLAFQMAKDKNPFSLTPIYNLAQLYLRYGFYVKACETFAGLYKRNKNDGQVALGAATCKLFQNNSKEAVRIFSSLDSSVLKSPEAALNYAMALQGQQKTEEARRVLEEMDQTGKDSAPWKDYYEKVLNIVGGTP